MRKTKRKQRQKNKAFKELVAQERDNKEEVSNPPPKRKKKSLTVKLPLRWKVSRAPPSTDNGLETSGSTDEDELPKAAEF